MYQWLENTSWLGNSSLAWVTAGIFALAFYILTYSAARIVAARCRSLASRRPGSTLLHIVAATTAATRGWLLLLLGIALGLSGLDLTPLYDKADALLGWIIAALFGSQVALWISTALVGWLKRATPEGSMQKTNPIIYSILTWTVELLVWVTLLLILLAQADVKIGAFIASLGVGGIAIAMAAKNVLEDLFASLAIGLDKPFEEGEFIAFGDELGTVRKVGIKSTRIGSLSGEEIAIGNANLLSHLIHNYSRRSERRVVFGFHVPLDTPRDKVHTIAERVNDILDSEENTRRDRGHFMAIEPDGFRYEFVYYVLSPDMNVYCDVQQAINLKVMDALETMRVRFAMPMRMMYESRRADDESEEPAERY